MQISQLQVANDSVQDRLVLRIATSTHEEIRVFLTRRFLRELWPALTAMLRGHLQARPAAVVEQPTPPPAASTSFDQPFRADNPTYPLGSNPLLASEAVLEPAGEGNARLTLREGRERNFNVNLNAELLQALCSMLRAAAEQAKWELTLDYGQASPLTGKPGNALLH